MFKKVTAIVSVAISAFFMIAPKETVAEVFRPFSQCGIQAGAKIVKVTNLKPKGPGSLADAINVPGPTVVVFEVAGEVLLDADLDIKKPFITIAGETAPEPGITLQGATVRVHSHDVCIRHLAVRPGVAIDPKVSAVRDGIAVGGNPSKYGGPIQNVVIENVSVSWAVDENISIWHEGTNRVQIRNSIVAEALRSAGHPKGNHSMGLLIGSDVADVELSGLLFAHNNDRNPRISPRASVRLERSVVYNPGITSTEVFLDCVNGAYKIGLMDNVFKAGPDTRRDVTQFRFVDDVSRKVVDANSTCLTGFMKLSSASGSQDIYSEVLRRAGARPSQRDRVDLRVVEEVVSGTGGLRDEPPLQATTSVDNDGGRVFRMPSDPWHRNSGGEYLIAVELCRAHLMLGGEPSTDCKFEP